MDVIIQRAPYKAMGASDNQMALQLLEEAPNNCSSPSTTHKALDNPKVVPLIKRGVNNPKSFDNPKGPNNYNGPFNNS